LTVWYIVNPAGYPAGSVADVLVRAGRNSDFALATPAPGRDEKNADTLAMSSVLNWLAMAPITAFLRVPALSARNCACR
jgi:hypothetical protein